MVDKFTVMLSFPECVDDICAFGSSFQAHTSQPVCRGNNRRTLMRKIKHNATTNLIIRVGKNKCGRTGARVCKFDDPWVWSRFGFGTVVDGPTGMHTLGRKTMLQFKKRRI